MVSAALLEQILSLPVSDRVELVERLTSSIPEPPVLPGIPSTRDELKTMLDESRSQLREHPESTMTIAQARHRFRARRA